MFQLAAGVGLAVGVFRAPYHSAYSKLSAILDGEEVIIKGRADDGAFEQAKRVGAARIDLLLARRSLEPKLLGPELLIWLSVIYSAVMLCVSALEPDTKVSIPSGLRLIGGSVVPVVAASFWVWKLVKKEFADVRQVVAAL